MNIFRSIKWELQIWQMLLLAGVLTSLLSLHYHLRQKELIAAVDSELQSAVIYALPILSPMKGAHQPPRFDAPLRMHPREPMPAESQTPPEEVAQKLLARACEKGLYFAVWRLDGTVRDHYGHVPEDLTPSTLPLPINEQQTIVTHNGCRNLIMPHQQGLIIVIGKPLNEVVQQMAVTRMYLLLTGLAVMLAGFGMGWLLINKTLRPINVISRTAEGIADGDHSRRIELAEAPEELAGLAHTLNLTFDALDAVIQGQRRFSADASHELRTPVAVVIAQAEAILKRDRSTEEYKNALQACLRAGRRMKNMTESLLSLARIDQPDFACSTTNCDLNVILTGAVDAASLLSERHPVTFQALQQPLLAKVDATHLHQVVMNLLNNAIQHNPEGCALHVSLRVHNGQAEIAVSDTGTGIPAAHLPHIFERFYRVDTSRSRAQGGAGLGLSIVKGLIESHGGTILASSQPGEGTTFTILLPLT